MEKKKHTQKWTYSGRTLEWESPVAKSIEDILSFYGKGAEKKLCKFWNYHIAEGIRQTEYIKKFKD